MKAPIRTQADGLGDTYSLATAKNFAHAKDRTRQEFAQDADINNLLARYGVGAAMRPLEWGGEIDFDMDLTEAYYAIDQLKEAYPRLPEHIKRQYGSWGAVLEALHAGELRMEPPQEPKEEPNKPPQPGENDS